MCFERKWKRPGRVLLYAVEPLIKNHRNTKLYEYYKSLMSEIDSDNISNHDYEIQNKINCIIGKEYDCEMYELDKEAMNFKDFCAFIAMLIVKCVFLVNLSAIIMGESLFLQLNSDLDSFYIELNKKSIKKGHVVDLLLECRLYDKGKKLIDSISNSESNVENKKMYIIYKQNLEQRLKILDSLANIEPDNTCGTLNSGD